MSHPEPSLDIAGEIMCQYWARVDRLIAVARKAGMDLAVSSPITVHDERTHSWNLVWEHRFVEPGGTVTDGHPELTWIVYRCS